jgi:hypothetical protein
MFGKCIKKNADENASPIPIGALAVKIDLIGRVGE